MTQNRRLSDKILIAFDQACAEGALQVAEELYRALEVSLSSYGGKDAAEKRDDVAFIVAARDKLDRLKRERAA